MPEMSTVRHALQTCVETHGDICRHSRSCLLQLKTLESSRFASTATFAVLNVITLQLEAISLEDAFIALSYVWGQTSNTASWTDDDGSGSKQIHGDRIPPTLADAIAICRDLGYRYIWIDQISIDWKNPTASTSLMHKMDQIYASATATIIVACNNCADKRISCHTKLQFGSHSKNWPYELQQSSWSKRTWTYQEIQLSRRLLVITHSGMFFHCVKANNHLPIWALPGIHPVTCWSAYNTIVAEYTSRRLSYKIDTLNAIAGMARSLARFADDSFLAGIPSRLIYLGLLWQPIEPCSRQPQWPSWSWAGWIGFEQSMCTVIHPSHGHVEDYDADPYRKSSRLYSSLGKIKFHVPDSHVQLELEQETHSGRILGRYRQKCSNSCTFPCSQLANLETDKPFYENGILVFTAGVMKVRIEPTRRQSPKFPQLYQCHLLIEEDWVGSMFLPEDHLPAQPIANAEFVILTGLHSYSTAYKSEVFGGMLEPGPEAGAFQESFLESAREQCEQQHKGWINGDFHSQRGWHRSSITSRCDRCDWGDILDDPHRGMPYPPEVCMHHVLWIARDEDRDLVFRKGLGIVASTRGQQKETVRLA